MIIDMKSKDSEMIDRIDDDRIKEFTVEALTKFGTPEKLKEANKVAVNILTLLKKDKWYEEFEKSKATGKNKPMRPIYVDVIECAALLHNLFFDSHKYLTNYNSEDFCKLFEARYKLDSLIKSTKMLKQDSDALFQCIEGQLGNSTPVPLCKPAPNSPTATFADAVWLAKEYKA